MEILAIDSGTVIGVEFTALGDPQAQARHRNWQSGPVKGTYDPSKEAKTEFLLKVQQNAPEKPFIGPLKLEIHFRMPHCKGHYGTGRNGGILKKSAPYWHSNSRPDLDNLIKFVLDALNGIFYRDDGQVAHIQAYKLYSENPSTYIRITKMKGGD